ncbi:MAG: hypothetical protein EOO09_14975 [Chitinophagaceae bacterium]|nr:MAG: hypothetical protein EOO09_14975 [Chitinophagaceae bacterium]
MKTIPVLMVCSLLVIAFACSKDKFESKPRLEITEYSTKELYPGQALRISLKFYDKEGDINGDSAVAIINRLNLLPLPAGQDKIDTINALLPDFPPKDEGEIFFQLDYDFLKESTVENDTLRFNFSVRDKQGNRSETVTSDPVVIVLL